VVLTLPELSKEPPSTCPLSSVAPTNPLCGVRNYHDRRSGRRTRFRRERCLHRTSLAGVICDSRSSRHQLHPPTSSLLPRADQDRPQRTSIRVYASRGLHGGGRTHSPEKDTTFCYYRRPLYDHRAGATIIDSRLTKYCTTGRYISIIA
jgi:hypothetical protein